MPFIVRVLADDIGEWELKNTTARFYHYRPRMPAEIAEHIQVVSPAPLGELVDRDMFCFVNVDRGWMSKKVGARPETKFQLKEPTEEIRNKRRVRLRIKNVDTSARPPRVMLEEYGEKTDVQNS